MRVEIVHADNEFPPATDPYWASNRALRTIQFSLRCLRQRNEIQSETTRLPGQMRGNGYGVILGGPGGPAVKNLVSCNCGQQVITTSINICDTYFGDSATRISAGIHELFAIRREADRGVCIPNQLFDTSTLRGNSAQVAEDRIALLRADEIQKMSIRREFHATKVHGVCREKLRFVSRIYSLDP